MEKEEAIGELWLLADYPSEVRFVAEGTCTLRIIERNSFVSLLESDGVIARKVYKKFTNRLLKRLMLTPKRPTKQQVS